MTYPTQISVLEAIHILQNQAPQLSAETVPLLHAYGRVLAQDLASRVDHPSVDNSALDGYACRAADTVGATRDKPVKLNVIGDVPAGSFLEGEVGPGQAVSIYTGAPVPKGADAIIRVEDTARVGDEVTLFAPANENDIRPKGQDFHTGDVHLKRGRVLDAASVGLAASMGYAELSVARKPRVGILATGDEVIAPGTELKAGQVYNSNTFSVAGLIRAAGAKPVVLEHVTDDPVKLAAALERVGEIDLLLTSGGVSMGKYDFVRDLLFEGGEVYFWKIAMRPGGPALFGRWRGLPVLGLPGNPVSSMVAFLVLAKAFLNRATLCSEGLPYWQRSNATAGVKLSGAGAKETFARVKLVEGEAGLEAVSTGNQSSGVLTSMLAADAFAVIPPHTNYEPGDKLEVIRLEPYLR